MTPFSGITSRVAAIPASEIALFRNSDNEHPHLGEIMKRFEWIVTPLNHIIFHQARNNFITPWEIRIFVSACSRYIHLEVGFSYGCHNDCLSNVCNEGICTDTQPSPSLELRVWSFLLVLCFY